MKKFIFVFLASFIFIMSVFTPLKVNAFTTEQNFYPFNGTIDMFFVINNETSDPYRTEISDDGKYRFNNPQINNVEEIVIYQYGVGDVGYAEWTFPYSDEYDYYLLGTLTSYCTDNNLFNFKPTYIVPYYVDVDYGYSSFPYNISNTGIYDIDSYQHRGFGFYEKVDFSNANNTGIRHISFDNDIHGTGNLPEKLCLELGIMAFEKGTSQDVILSQILQQLIDMENSINSSINNATNKILSESLYGYDGSVASGAKDEFDSGASDLTAIEGTLNSSSTTFVNDFTSTGFDSGILTTLGASLTFVVTWFTNFWNMGGIWTLGLSTCFAIWIAFYILRTRSK